MPKFSRLKNSEISIFLEMLQNYPIIWNIRLKDYSNKLKRDGQITQMLNDLEKKNIKMDEEEFKARFKSIKDTYRKELKKVNGSKKSGTDPESLYIPKLIWYDQADSFLREIVSTRESSSNIDEDPVNPVKEGTDESLEEFENHDIEHLQEIGNKFDRRTHVSYDTQREQSKKQIKKDLKRKSVNSTVSSNVQDAMEHLDNIVSNIKETEDENYQFGRYVTSQLSSLPAIWSVMLKSEIQSAITKIVLQSLSNQQSESSKVFPSLYHQPSSRDINSYSSLVSYHSNSSSPSPYPSPTPSSNSFSPSSYPPSSSPHPLPPLPYPPLSSQYPPTPSLYSSPPSLNPPPSPSLNPSPSASPNPLPSSLNSPPSNQVTHFNFDENDKIKNDHMKADI